MKVFDVKTNKLVDTISTGGKKRADEMGYDDADQILAVANNAESGRRSG
jgi:hypothetical protein